eukprot:TRINITY_DN1708_c0_g2_i1.p1 TRINITY_DN1708_c0_g2~~TRINITY_DN1708_c0_g2_i1.p1  ORF type:complete len:299 (-),score=119.79 TRINITY_DN1708_c0_g2_i1:79-975(-)
MQALHDFWEPAYNFFEDEETKLKVESLNALIVCPIYLIVVYGLKLMVKQRWSISYLAFIHNMVLCIGSLVMVISSFNEGILYYQQHGLYKLYCSNTSDNALWFWSWIFYASKFYELFDTVLLVLNQKPLEFLHVFHHFIVIPLCLFFVRARMQFFYSAGYINGGIHVIMYYYFAMASIRRPPTWKKQLTTFQIIQFCYGISCWWPYIFVCSPGDEQFAVWIFNQFILVSFLLLFIAFYVKNYISNKNKQQQQQQIDRQKQSITTNDKIHESNGKTHNSNGKTHDSNGKTNFNEKSKNE